MTGHYLTLSDMLRARSVERPDVEYIYLVDGEDQELRVSYAELDRRARAIAAELQRRGLRGTRALLLFPPNERYIDAFFGCLYAGVVAVPAYPPDPSRLERSLPRLFAIFEDAQASSILTTAELMGLAEGVAAASPALTGVSWIATDLAPAEGADDWTPVRATPEDLAFLQYTSGSTSLPRGVRLTHGNLIANLQSITDAFAITPDTLGMTWLPPYHDMGLIGGMLAPLFNGLGTVCMSPLTFLQKPSRWLRAISKYRAAISGGPNFAYDLALRKLTPADAVGLDLTSWRLAFCGAEPVRADTMSRFARGLAEYGFRASALYPCYGLAESTLIVAGGPAGRGAHVQWVDAQRLGGNDVVPVAPASPEGRALVSSGNVLPAYAVAVVSPSSRRPCRETEVGEIWVHGPSVASGYWRDTPDGLRTFDGRLETDDGRVYLRTGDLGFVRDNELFVTGRIKDVIILRGRNHYPQDIESTVEGAHGAVRRGCCAVVAETDAGEERLVVFAEIERRYHERRGPRGASTRDDRRGPERRSDVPTEAFAVRPGPFDPELVRALVVKAVSDQHGIAPHLVVLLTPGAVRKTSSGKVQRQETLRAFRSGALALLETNGAGGGVDVAPPSIEDLEEALSSRAPRSGEGVLAQLLRALRTTMGSIPIEADEPMSALGLDSIQSIQLAHALQTAAGLHVPPSAFLRDTTPRQIASAIAQRAYGNLPGLASLPADSSVRDRGAPLSIAQEALLQLVHVDPERTDYSVGVAFEVEVASGDADARVTTALRDVGARHAMLRARLSPGGESYLTLQDELWIVHDDGTGRDHAGRLEWARHQIEHRFALESEPLVRLFVSTSGAHRVTVVVVAHHLVVDLWSLIVVLKDFVAALATKRSAPDSSVVDFAQYVAWQKEYPQTESARVSIEFWRNCLAGAPAYIDWGDPLRTVGETRASPLSLPGARSSSVRRLARQLSTTSVVVLLAAYAAALCTVVGADEIVIGLPVVNRPLVEFADMVGYCANVVPVRLRCRPRDSFADLVRVARAALLDALEHQFVPLPVIVQTLAPPRVLGRQPLVQAVLAVESPHLHVDDDLVEVALGNQERTIAAGDAIVRAIGLGSEAAPFELVLTLVDGSIEMRGTVTHRTSHVGEATVNRILDVISRVLDGAVDDSGLSTSQLTSAGSIADPAPSEALGDSPLVPLAIARLAESAADRIAVRQGEEQVTYGALWASARSAAGALGRLGVRVGELVAVSLPPGPELVRMQLAVWLAGASYVSLDTEQPPRRLDAIVDLSQARVVISATSDASSGRVTPRDLASHGTSTVPDSLPACDDLAYVIFTSGSTGAPKGVAVPHRGLASLVAWHATTYHVVAGTVCSSVASPGFDASVWEIWGTLNAGGTLVFPAAGSLPGDVTVRRLWERECVEVGFAPTPIAEAIMDEPPPSLRFLLTGGDVLRRWPGRSHPLLVNHYGPTEASVVATAHPLSSVRSPGLPPIGAALPGMDVRVLDDEMRSCYADVPGELCLGGRALARGYLADPAETAARWWPDPAGGGRRVYRTGDLVTRAADGVLRFRGRRDAQVKVLGNRIEPAEIEATLHGEPGVTGAAVVDIIATDGRPTLVAFVVTSGSADEAGLRAAVAGRVPRYMIPSRVVILADLPRSPSGKIDRRALRAVAASLPRSRPDLVAPTTALERVLLHVWRDVLGVDEIGVTDDFFEMGGHSLLIGRSAARLTELLDVELPLARLARFATIRELAHALTANDADLEERAAVAVEVMEMSDDEANALLRAAAGG